MTISTLIATLFLITSTTGTQSSFQVTGITTANTNNEIKPLDISTSFGLKWTMPDEDYTLNKSEFEMVYHYVTPLKDAEVYIKLFDTKQSNAFNITNKLVSERTTDLKADGFAVNGVDVKSYLTNINTQNFIHGLLATAGSDANQGSILYFYFHSGGHVVNIHVIYPSVKNVNAITKNDIKKLLASFKFGS